MRHNLMDVTFTIPFRAENKDRLVNLNIVIEYLLHHFETNIIIAESGVDFSLKSIWQKSWDKHIKVLFLPESRDIFHKTYLLNLMAKEVKTSIIASHDADIIIPPEQYLKAAKTIKRGSYHFCFPFKKNIVNIPKKSIEQIRNNNFNLDKADFNRYIWEANNRDKRLCDGGCLFMDKKEFINIGMENEQFYNYNLEDAERRLRIQKLGYKIKYIDGHMCHLEHSRTVTSFWLNPNYISGQERYNNLKEMTKRQVKKYIKEFKKQQDGNSNL